MRRRRVSSAASVLGPAVAIAMGACSGRCTCARRPAAVRPPEPTLITLERGACYGSCPVYSLQLHPDGRVEFRGEHFTGRCGTAEGRLSPGAWASLVERFHAIDYWQLRDVYSCGHDAPHAITSIRVGEVEKRVDYDPLCEAPPGLLDLQHAIDDAAGAKRWAAGCGATSPNIPALAFDKDSSALARSQDAALGVAVQTLHDTPVAAGLVLYGSASKDEKDAATLAAARVAAVKNALVARAVDPAKIEIASGVASVDAPGAAARGVAVRLQENPCGCPGGSFGK